MVIHWINFGKPVRFAKGDAGLPKGMQVCQSHHEKSLNKKNKLKRVIIQHFIMVIHWINFGKPWRFAKGAAGLPKGMQVCQRGAGLPKVKW